MKQDDPRSPRTPAWPFSKSKFNLMSDRVNLVAPASPIECLLYLPNVRAIQYKLWPERLTRLGNSNVLRLPVDQDERFQHNNILRSHEPKRYILSIKNLSKLSLICNLDNTINKLFIYSICILPAFPFGSRISDLKRFVIV